MPRKSILNLFIVSVALAAPAVAQVRQYTRPGGAADASEGRRESLEQAVEDARWNAGPLRLDPAFWISDLTFAESSTPGVGSDLSVRAGAGLRAYLPLGSRTTLAAYALPEYVWWEDREDERRLNQRFGVGSFTYFNRLSVEIAAERIEDFDFATSEVLERVTQRTDRLAVALEVPLFSRLSLFAQGVDSTFESLAESDDLAILFTSLDREDRAYRGGFRYYLKEEFHLGGGVGQAESEFDLALNPADRSNSGSFWYVDLSYERPKLSISGLYQENELEGEPGSTFGLYDGSTGNARIAWRPRERLGARLYASRALAYSLRILDETAYVENRIGAGVDIRLGGRFGIDLYAESGTLDFQAELGGSNRTDDLESYGATLSVDLGRRFNFRVGYRQTSIRPSDGGPDREIDEIQGSLGFGLSGSSSGFY